jgi:CRISPR-associated protein Cmr4
MSNNFFTRRYLIQTIDPVHIGTGGMRLGRVDNSIVREPGTKLPKIPGTSLNGAIRYYSAYRYGKTTCAGQQGHCCRPTCPICYTFGHASDERAHAGVVSICDARILFFPVYSMAGPVWITGLSSLKDFDSKYNNITVNENEAKMASGLSEYKHLNLGWLMVEKMVENEGELNLPDLPSDIPDTVKKHLVVVSDKFFSQIVNSNLEVRTSVSINPETGAAEEGALFTYEAIPRAAYLWFDVVVDDYRKLYPNHSNLDSWTNLLSDTNTNWNGLLSDTNTKRKAIEDLLRKAGLKIQKSDEEYNKAKNTLSEWINEELTYLKSLDANDSIEIVSKGLEWAEHLGVGGMGTRGFGRMKFNEVKNDERKT